MDSQKDIAVFYNRSWRALLAVFAVGLGIVFFAVMTVMLVVPIFFERNLYFTPIPLLLIGLYVFFLYIILRRVIKIDSDAVTIKSLKPILWANITGIAYYKGPAVFYMAEFLCFSFNIGKGASLKQHKTNISILHLSTKDKAKLLAILKAARPDFDTTPKAEFKLPI